VACSQIVELKRADYPYHLEDMKHDEHDRDDDHQKYQRSGHERPGSRG
jgi:hypothetical protein